MAAPGPPQQQPVMEHQREPCPDRIIDDIGGAFAMGAVGGGVWHFIKGMKNSPPRFRLTGAVEVSGLLCTALCAALPCTFSGALHLNDWLAPAAAAASSSGLHRRLTGLTADLRACLPAGPAQGVPSSGRQLCKLGPHLLLL